MIMKLQSRQASVTGCSRGLDAVLAEIMWREGDAQAAVRVIGQVFPEALR